MCEYCDMTLVDVEHACEDYFIHKPFCLRDEHTNKRIKADGNHSLMYLREYRKAKVWSIICEFADDYGTVVEIPIIYCPRCGNKLAGKNTRKNIINQMSDYAMQNEVGLEEAKLIAECCGKLTSFEK